MDECLECRMGKKVKECCGSNPETGESVRLRLDSGRVVDACPSLDALGECMDYERRPDDCREYLCDALRKKDLYDIFTEFI